jgi:hypothetical protein
MKQGRVFFAGHPEEIVPHFSKLGKVCPSNYNPSDFLMTLVQTISVEEADEGGFFMEIPAFAKSQQSLVDSDQPKETNASSDAVQCFFADQFSLQAESGFGKQFHALVLREALNTIRDVAALGGRFGVTIFLNVLFGLIYLNACGRGNSTSDNFNNHFGAIAMVMISGMFGAAQPIMLSFPFERPMFLREYTTGTCKIDVVLLILSTMQHCVPLH